MTGDPLPSLAVSTLSALLTLAFAALALGVARRTPPPLAAEGHRAAWHLAGAAFAVVGAHALAAAAAGWAGVAPPVGEAARAPVLLVLAVALLRLARYEGAEGWRGGPALWGVLVLALLPGATSLAWLPRVAPSPTGAAVVAGVSQAVAALLLLSALLAALLRDAVDQLLWLALALFAVRAAVGAGLPLLPGGTDGAGSLLSAAVLAAMVALAARRLALARRGARVPPLLAPLRPRPVRATR